MKVQSGLDDLNVLPDGHIAQENVGRIGHRNDAMPEPVSYTHLTLPTIYSV